MGEVIAPRAWCRNRSCREAAGDLEHFLGDGCSCHPHGRPAAEDARPVRLTARAARLDAFACRACGEKTRDMVEYPELFFRCQPCAAADRWPRLGGGRAR